MNVICWDEEGLFVFGESSDFPTFPFFTVFLLSKIGANMVNSYFNPNLIKSFQLFFSLLLSLFKIGADSVNPYFYSNLSNFSFLLCFYCLR
jgi:hypothetical protein